MIKMGESLDYVRKIFLGIKIPPDSVKQCVTCPSKQFTNAFRLTSQ